MGPNDSWTPFLVQQIDKNKLKDRRELKWSAEVFVPIEGDPQATQLNAKNYEHGMSTHEQHNYSNNDNPRKTKNNINKFFDLIIVTSICNQKVSKNLEIGFCHTPSRSPSSQGTQRQYEADWHRSPSNEPIDLT